MSFSSLTTVLWAMPPKVLGMAFLLGLVPCCACLQRALASFFLGLIHLPDCVRAKLVSSYKNSPTCVMHGHRMPGICLGGVVWSHWVYIYVGIFMSKYIQQLREAGVPHWCFSGLQMRPQMSSFAVIPVGESAEGTCPRAEGLFSHLTHMYCALSQPCWWMLVELS